MLLRIEKLRNISLVAVSYFAMSWYQINFIDCLYPITHIYSNIKTYSTFEFEHASFREAEGYRNLIRSKSNMISFLGLPR